MELGDFLGSADVVPLVEMELLEETGVDHPFGRYQNCMPSLSGKRYFAYHFLRQVITLKPGVADELHALLMLKAQPLWLPGNSNGNSFSWTGHPTYDPQVKKRDELERLLLSGYMPMDELWNVHRIDTEQMIAARLCEYRLVEGDGIVYALQPTERGNEYLYGPPALGQLLLKPGMGTDLFKACLRAGEERLGATG